MKEGNGVVHSQLFHVIILTLESKQIIFFKVFLFVLVCVCTVCTVHQLQKNTFKGTSPVMTFEDLKLIFYMR